MPRAVPAPPRSPLAVVILQCAAARGRRPKARSAREGCMIVLKGNDNGCKE